MTAFTTTDTNTANNNLAAKRIAHESEVQRQHVRVNLPAKVKIGESLYEVQDLSSGGFRIKSHKSIAKEKTEEIKFILPFDNFVMQFGVNADEVYFDRKSQTAGFRFTVLNASQISLINYMIKSYLAGHLISEGDIINIVSRNNFTRSRTNKQKKKSGFFTFLKRLVPVVMILGVGAAGLLFLYGNIYEGTAVIQTFRGQVQGEQVNVRTYATGIFRNILEPNVQQVATGQPIGVIESISRGATGGGEIILKSPCDCHIVERMAKDGEFRSIGESVFKLTPITSSPKVTTLLPTKDAMRLRLQDDVNMNIAGEGKFIAGYVDNIRTFNSDNTSVTIRPRDPLPVEMIGRPTYVEFLVQ